MDDIYTIIIIVSIIASSKKTCLCWLILCFYIVNILTRIYILGSLGMHLHVSKDLANCYYLACACTDLSVIIILLCFHVYGCINLQISRFYSVVVVWLYLFADSVQLLNLNGNNIGIISDIYTYSMVYPAPIDVISCLLGCENIISRNISFEMNGGSCGD